jgi:curli biogenesis system outer membrane secretion channel CsgG
MRELSVLGCALLVGLLAVPAPSSGLPKIFSKKDKGEAYVPSGGWEPYIQDEEGNTRPFRQPLEQNKDKDWLFVKYTEYKGPKIRVAVMEVDNQIASVEQARNAGAILIGSQIATIPVADIESLLTHALFSTNRFFLVERKDIGTVMDEQDFGDSGRVSKPTAAKIGKVLGAEYLVYASINEYAPEKSKADAGGVGAGGRILGGLGLGKSTSEVTMSFKIIDATSGQVLFTAKERAEAGQWGLNFSGFAGVGAGGAGLQRNSPIGYAVEACINKMAYRIATQLKDRTWRGSVAKVAGDQVYINAGSDAGLQVGMTLIALSKGEALEDPETGLSLGEDTVAIGRIQITTIKEGFAIATILQGCEGLKVGDRVEVDQAGP